MKRKKIKIKTFIISRGGARVWGRSEASLSSLTTVCYSGFQQVTGIKLKPGEIGTFKLVRVK